MSYVRDNTTTATKAEDIYQEMATLLTANGWVQQGTDIDDATTGRRWRVWKNPAANCGLVKDFHIAVGVNIAGDGALGFRLFEDWSGSGNLCQRFVPAEVPDGAITNNGSVAEDRFGKALSDSYSSGVLMPIPWSPGTGDYARGAGDYSIGAFDGEGSTSDAAVQSMLDNAPHEVNFLSEFVAEHQVACDDQTAGEYVISVDAKRVAIAVKRVFTNVIRGAYVGAYEPLHVLDPFPVCVGRLQGYPRYNGGDNMHSFTRFWGFDNIPFEWAVRAGHYFYAEGMREHTQTQAILRTSYDTVSDGDFGDFDCLAGGAVFSRAAFFGRAPSSDLSASANRALLYDVLIGSKAKTDGSPNITFGDEVVVNGQTWIFVGCSANYQLDDGHTSASASDDDPVLLPKF